MAEHDPKQVITEYISQPLGPLEPSPPPPPGVQLRGQPGMIRRGGGLGARASTVQFLRARSLPTRQVHVVAFENEEGQQEQWFRCVRQDLPGSWRNAGGANIGKGEQMPQRDSPWVNLAGGWSRDLFWAGGRVLDNGRDVVRVRLISANGIILEDLVQDGLVLFVSDQWVQRPLQVELYDRSGDLVGTHQALKPHPSEHAGP